MIRYIEAAIDKARITAAPYGAEWSVDHAVEVMTGWFSFASKVFVIGNGGSAAIASHVACDLMRAGRGAMTLTDPAQMTRIANDMGYDQVFSEQIRQLAGHEDMLIAISSSGRSPNIINACHQAKRLKLDVVTFSGFESTNELRTLGDVNFYVPSSHYGVVEMAHHVILHSITDKVLEMTKKKAAA